MKTQFTEEHTVACYEADANHNLRPAAMLDWMQEAAGRDATNLGFGYDDMISTNTAWVLSRLKLVFHNYPKWRDVVNLRTWHKGADRIFYLRDFILESESGEQLVAATTSWLIIDLASRRMVRNKDLAENFSNEEMGHALQPQAEKIIFPKGIEPESVGTHNVVWSDIDTNGHVNNVKYAIWALDAVDYEVAQDMHLSELLINYDSEVLPGQEVALYRIPVLEDGLHICYVTGKVEGKSVFSIKMTFAPCVS